MQKLASEIYTLLSEGIPMSVRELRDALPKWAKPMELQEALNLLKREGAITPALTPPSFRPDLDPSGSLRWTIVAQTTQQIPTSIEDENTVPLSPSEQTLFEREVRGPVLQPKMANIFPTRDGSVSRAAQADELLSTILEAVSALHTLTRQK